MHIPAGNASLQTIERMDLQKVSGRPAFEGNSLYYKGYFRGLTLTASPRLGYC